MSARMAHEIKNPVSSIYTGIQLMQKKLNLSEKDNNYLELLLTVTKRITEITDDLLAYSRPPNLKKSIGEITQPLERAIEILTPQMLKQRIRMVRQYGRNLPRLMIDAKQMEQVFLNIILNALQAMDRGGNLEVAVQNRNSNTLKIRISDTGKGIPPEDMDKIFNPFYSTKTHGTGLGLATAKKIVEEHGGFISVDSALGKYTTFKIQLKLGPKNERSGNGYSDHDRG
jgi:two-component system sensor histidine kinase HydH